MHPFSTAGNVARHRTGAGQGGIAHTYTLFIQYTRGAGREAVSQYDNPCARITSSDGSHLPKPNQRLIRQDA